MTDLSDSMLEHVRDALRGSSSDAARYELRGEIGRGGMGTVFRAVDHELGREVALKVLSHSHADARLSERLRREARIAASLEHPGIVPVYDVGLLEDGRPFYVMKLVSGARLDELIASGAARADRLDVFLRICEAVAYAHARGVVHRDLKPENVRVGPFGEVQVLDFGVAKLLASPAESCAIGSGETEGSEPLCAPTKTVAGTIVGTPGWMAPEQERGEPDVDARADVHALGGLLRALVEDTQDPPARALVAIVDRARAAERDARYARVEDLADDVRRFMAGDAVRAFPEGPLARGLRLARRHRVAIALVLSYVALRIVLFFFARS